MNTAMGNVLIMCGLMWIYCQELEVKARLLNDGDDCVTIIERADLSRFTVGFEAWFAEMGFKMTVEEPVDVFERIVFCQSQPVFDGKRWLMVRDPRKTLAKDLITFQGVGNLKQWNRVRAAISECGLALAGGIPVLDSFYRCLGRGAGADMNHEAVSYGFRQLSKGMRRHSKPITEEARYSFYRAFGWLPDAQRSLESSYDQTPLYWSPTNDEASGFPPLYWYTTGATREDSFSG
jgi:hypothetical protein